MEIIVRKLILALAILALCASVSFAQEEAKNAPAPAVQQPAQGQVVVKSIFDYKKELAITDKQEKDLRAVLMKLQDYMTGKRKELDALRANLSKLMAERADLKKIKSALDKIAKIQADASYEDVVRSREVENKLTAAQMSNWRKIQEDFRKNIQEQQAAARAQEAKQ